MTSDTLATSSRHPATMRSEAVASETDDPSGLALMRPSRTSTWASTSPEDAGPVAPQANNPMHVSTQAIARWTEHVLTLSDRQRQLFLRGDPGSNFVEYTNAVDGIISDKLKTSKVVRATKWIEPLVGFVDMCRPLADALGGMYPPAGLVLGGVFFALSVTKRVVKYQEALVQFLTKVMSSLAQLNKFKAVFPDAAEIQTGLVDVFDIILQVCAKASTLFVDDKGKEKSTSRLFLRSFEKDFGEWKQALDTSLENFDRTVQLAAGQKLGDLHGSQMMALRMQLETYKAIRRSETKRDQEENERRIRQLQQEQDERRTKLLAWLSPLSFQATHNSILATTLDRTGGWLLRHETYLSWKTQSSEALLWVYGKHGSGKSHLAARVIEELRVLCRQMNVATSDHNDVDHGDTGSAPDTANNDELLIQTPAEGHSALVFWQVHDQRETIPESSADNAAWSSMARVDGLRSAAIDNTTSTSNRAALAYIYCSSHQVERSDRHKTGRSTQPGDGYDTTGLLSCLLKQLYQFLPKDQDVPELTHACFESKEDLPSREMIMNGIRSVISILSQTFIVADGLDECSGVSSLEFESFCNFLASLANFSSNGPLARILIFSRPGYQAIINVTHGCPSIEVDQGANTDDISLFIDDRSGELTKDSASLKEIQDHLLDYADGMFLWVSLVIDSIKQERTAKKMKVAARNMPRGLTGAYADALRRIIAAEPSIRDMALKALLWTANSKRPLSKAQFLEVLAIEEGMSAIGEDERLDDDIPLTKDCADLLVLKDEQYMLLHPSLGDFLRGLSEYRIEGLELYQNLQINAPRILGTDCLTYLNFDAFKEGPAATEDSFQKALQCHPFLEYASDFWGDHLREALDQDDLNLKERALELLRPQMRRYLLHQVYMRSSIQKDSMFPFPCGTTLLHMLSIFGLYQLVPAYSTADGDIDQADGFGNFPLDYASQNGHKLMCNKIVDEHLSRNHENSQGIHRRCRTKSWLMGRIVYYHWMDLMVILLELGHSTTGDSTTSDSTTGTSMPRPTALHMASSRGHTDMIERLLQSGVDPDIRDGGGYTPLMIAAQHSHLAAMEILLQHGADTSCQGPIGKTALHMVSSLRNGKKELAAALLDQGGSIEAKTPMGETPLHCASASGSESMVAFLLDRGANEEAVVMGNRMTALIIASQRGKSEIVRLLLSRGANITAVSDRGSSALQQAAATGGPETLSELLATPDGRRTLDRPDNNGYTALHYAVSNGSVACAKRLLDEGADLNSANNAGETPLLIALDRGHTSLAQMLVDVYNANPHHVNYAGLTAMHFSAARGIAEDIQMLLSWGVNAVTKNKYGQTPLHLAVSQNNVKFVERYVRCLSAENALDRQKHSDPLDWKPELGLWRSADGDLAIHRAVSLRNFEHVKYLCNPEVVSEPGANGQTPLHYAVIANDATMVKYLLEQGADVERSYSSGNGPLMEALGRRNENIAQILVDWGANIEATDDQNWRPLHYAAALGYTQLARRLLNSGCELEPQTDEGDTPFWLACDNNYPDTIDLFLAHGVGNVTIQSSNGSTYAHVTATRGQQDVLEKLVQMDTSLVIQTDYAGFDPLCEAAWFGELAVVEVLIECGASPDGPPYTHMTPLAFATRIGAIRIVDILLRSGAKVDKTGALLRTPLMWAVLLGYVRTAHHLLKAGANPFLKDEMGLSAFDLAVGKPAMVAILKPWHLPSGEISHHHDSQIYLILRFISRAARFLARMIDDRGYPDPSFDISMIYLSGLRYATLRIGAHEARMRNLIGSCLHAQPGGTRTAVPVKKAEIIREYRSLCSDSKAEFTCDFCYAEVNGNLYACSICQASSCSNCQVALSALPLRERLEEFGRLRRLETDVLAVLRALEPTKYQGAGIMSRILCQGALLQHWVSQRNMAYQNWRSSRTVYKHFQQEDFLGWKTIDTLSSILSLSARSRKEAIDPDSADTEQDEDMEDDWSKLSEQWRDIFAFNTIREEPSTTCVHHCRQFLKIPRNNENSALDSSGRLSAEFFEFLANKYEAASNIETSIIEFLESTRFSSRSSVDPDVERQSSNRSLQRLEDFFQLEQEVNPHPETHVESTWKNGSVRDLSENSSTQSSESIFSGEDLEDDDGTATDLEDFLDSLLAKRSCLVKEGGLTKEDNLVFNTAWNMAQAIVYPQDTLQPSLNEIVDKGDGYYTAPSTPVTPNSAGHGGTTPSSYGTPRSMSPVSWIMDLDEQSAAMDMEIPELFLL